MKKVFLLVLILMFSILSIGVTGTTTSDQGRGIKFIIKNPDSVEGVIPEGTDTFAVIIKGLGEDLLLKESFEGSNDIEMSVKLPGGLSYDFYFMGYKGNVLTCYQSIVGKTISGDEPLELNVEMKKFYHSIGTINGEGTHEFREPEYIDQVDPRKVKWARTYTDIKIEGQGIGEFVDGVSSSSHAYFKYSLDTWGKTYYFYPHVWSNDLPLFREYSFSATDTNTLTRTTKIFFPLLYTDDNSPYPYDQATFELWIPLEMENLDVGFLCPVDLDELLGDVNVKIE